MATVTYTLEVSRCDKCPNVEVEETRGAGFASDFICSLTKTKVNGYVEWERDWQGVGIPLDCPLRPKENKQLYDVGL